MNIDKLILEDLVKTEDFKDIEEVAYCLRKVYSLNGYDEEYAVLLLKGVFKTDNFKITKRGFLIDDSVELNIFHDDCLMLCFSENDTIITIFGALYKIGILKKYLEDAINDYFE